MQRKCCVHCPGEVTRTGEPAREHACTVPGYVSGSLRLADLGPNGQSNVDRTDPIQPSPLPPPAPKTSNSCYERFAEARRCHSDNLQHQPLPDRVDDAIFTVDRPAEDLCYCDTVRRCQSILPRRQFNRKKELSRVHRYAPALGCKKPTTYMDLAICWETPVNPIYEPRRACHIDGSDGGPAPAIFSLVQHAASQVDVRDGCIPMKRDAGGGGGGGGGEGDYFTRHECDKCEFCLQGNREMDPDDLCRNLNLISLTNERKPLRPPVGAAARKKRAEFLQHWPTHGERLLPQNRKPIRPVRSAAFLQKRGCTVVDRKTNGLPGRTQVPRPRTPYARRSFCIDTLTPPFSVVNGCRDADYPEHWRLTSIYQQSYRNPKKMREGRTLLNYDRSYV